MADQEERQGKLPIPALPVKYKKKTKKLKNIEQTEERKASIEAATLAKKAAAEARKAASDAKTAARKERKRALEKTRVYLASAFERWKQLKETKSIQTDWELAVILLDR